ncbi:exopolyphosphatase [Apostasia shenzhenica]|uniref:Exopolyphosphatase n=1 Tax=Apostasia shenzhenica TaxID=1088818 RepID=A0A2I0AMA6_9ASPA|nr:exopolyphosphatase [Apostasia shenzhenica]
MNDWFFGAVEGDRRRDYNLGSGDRGTGRPEREFVRGRKSTSAAPAASRLTQEWLEEAKRTVARNLSPARSSGSPRFSASTAAAAQAQELSQAPSPDLRDPRSRSARRNRPIEGVSNEILQKSSVRHIRNKSESLLAGDDPVSPAGRRLIYPFDDPDPRVTGNRSPTSNLPPKLPPIPKSSSRFQYKSSDLRRPSSTPENDPQQQPPLSPPRTLGESAAHRRSFSSSTCSVDQVSGRRKSFSGVLGAEAGSEVEDGLKQINSFLRQQRDMIGRVSDGEVYARAKIVLSSYTPNTSSMVAAICYAWLLENRMANDKCGRKDEVVVPVINMKRARMWEQKQAAWLFRHFGIDASSLVFSDELDLEGLLMARQLSLLVVGQDILRTNGEVGSRCTILTDNYCEEAYNLLQTPTIKRLLLAGILLDTQNLNNASKRFSNRDSEAVRLLLVGSSPSYREILFEQLMQDHNESSFLQALRQNYGNPSSEAKHKPSPSPAAAHVPAPAPCAAKASERTPKAKSKFSFSRLFVFGSK